MDAPQWRPPEMTTARVRVPKRLVTAIERRDTAALLDYLGADAVAAALRAQGLVEECPYGETLMHYAAWHGNDEAVVILVRAGASINEVGEYSGCTPLHSAAANGHLGTAALLICLGADVRATNNDGWTALHSCCLRGHKNVAWLLQSKGLSPDLPTKDGKTARQLLDQALAKQQSRVPTVPGLPRTSIHDLLENGKLKIQIASDTHVEFYQSLDQVNASHPDMIKPSAPILALLGDIGNPALPSYRDFIYQQAERFKLVLVLAGNHEFYSPCSAPPHPTIEELNAAIQLICSEAPHKNVLYMDGKVLELPGFSIMGCILWSDIPQHKRQNAARRMNDYRLIFKSNTHNFTQPDVFTPDDSAAWHKKEVTWLEEQIRISMRKGQKAVILTHHTPSYQVNGSGLAFSSSLERLFKNNSTNVEVWAHGHTHYNDDIVIQGTRVVSNMVGYKHERNSDYRPDLVITVD